MTASSQDTSFRLMHRTRRDPGRAAERRTRGGRPSAVAAGAEPGRRWAVLLLAFGQVVTTAVVFGTGAGALSSDSSDPTITPAGYAFAIWTIPILSCLVFAAYAFTRSTVEPYRSIGWPLAATMTGFNLWLWFATKNWVWATVAVFAAMLALLAVAMRAAQQHPAPTGVGGAIVATTLGVYAGWTTVAVWANLAAALHANGSGLSNDEIGWQLAVLIGAAVSSVAGVWLARAGTAYVAAVVWALVAVVVATAQRDAPVLAVTGAAAVALVAATAAVRRQRARLSHA